MAEPKTDLMTLAALRMHAAASLAGTLMALANRPHSVEEAAELTHHCSAALWPDATNDRSQALLSSAAVKNPHT